MSYIGTGTQGDPAIPGTANPNTGLPNGDGKISDLVEIFAAAKAAGSYWYVKLCNDIDCADDDNYLGYYTYLDMSYVRKLYSDNQYKIRGLCLKPDGSSVYYAFLLSSGTNCETIIDSIDIIDLFYKSVGTNSSSIFGFTSNNSHSQIVNCHLTISCYPRSGAYQEYYGSFTYGNNAIIINNSSIYLKFNENRNVVSRSMYMYLWNSNNNVFIFDGGSYNYESSWSGYLIDTRQTCSYNAVICKNSIISRGMAPSLSFSSAGNYVAFINPSGVTNQSEYPISSTSYQIVMATDSWYNAETNPTGVWAKPADGNNKYYCTLSQIKDMSYLQSIGFVP